MKTYMALDGLRWSRDSGSANCDIPRSAVFGRPGGGFLIVIISVIVFYFDINLFSIKSAILALPLYASGFIFKKCNFVERLTRNHCAWLF